ncbi:MAG: hypothetical protein HOB18_08185 [Nitrospina sp.]|nr:hypothetical protein [Nitrospina sp.]MBT5632851.1 hypothetical protein [Nitrospina sp.]MBT6717598.1 hypothetical protein [Nitrospina sp.]
MNKLIILIAVSLTVSIGCARTLVSMKEECSSYGFKEGSDKYGECMMTLSQRDIDRRSKAWDDWQKDQQRYADERNERHDRQRQSIRDNQMEPLFKPTPSINCTSTTLGNTTRTNCY